MTPQPSLDEQELRTGMHSYDVVDAFAREPLLGNPVAVFYDSDDLSARTMQRIAQEMHLSETTFVLRPLDLVRDQGKVVAARMRQPVPTWESFDRADELLDVGPAHAGRQRRAPADPRCVPRTGRSGLSLARLVQPPVEAAALELTPAG